MDRRKVNYSELAGGKQALILGETHHQTKDYQDEVVNSITTFKLMGFTHFAMEMLQTDLDPKKENAMRRHIQETFTPGHVRIYQAAKQAGLIIVPLDMPISKQKTYTPSLYKDRNHWMLEAAMKHLNQGHKMVLFMHHGHAIGGSGSIHTSDKDGVYSLIKSKGVSSVYIQIVGGAWETSSCTARGADISMRAQNDKVQNTRFSSRGANGVDHIIHLPQNCTSSIAR